jgi:hypothetical protein
MVEYRLVAYNGDKLIHRSNLIAADAVSQYKEHLYSLGATIVEMWLIKGIIK